MAMPQGGLKKYMLFANQKGVVFTKQLLYSVVIGFCKIYRMSRRFLRKTLFSRSNLRDGARIRY